MQADLSRGADCFLVWRTATSVRWRCTVAEIAEEAQLSPGRVDAILQARGWSTLVDSDQETDKRDREPEIDLLFRHGQRAPMRVTPRPTIHQSRKYRPREVCHV